MEGATPMSWTVHRRKTWYCPGCGRTFERGNEAATVKMICDCDTLLSPAEVTYSRHKPDPDPLEALVVDALAGGEQP